MELLMFLRLLISNNLKWTHPLVGQTYFMCEAKNGYTVSLHPPVGPEGILLTVQKERDCIFSISEWCLPLMERETLRELAFQARTKSVSKSVVLAKISKEMFA